MKSKKGKFMIKPILACKNPYEVSEMLKKKKVHTDKIKVVNTKMFVII